MMPTLERIIAEVDALSPEEKEKLREHLDREAGASTHPDEEFIRATRGMFAHVPTSTEAFARRKQEEIDLEDRRNRSQ